MSRLSEVSTTLSLLAETLSLFSETLISAFNEYLLIFAVAGAFTLVVLLWYLWAMGRLFPRIGLPAGHGWIPIVNEWRLVSRAGLPGWLVLCYLVPGLGVIPLILRTIAQHRIGKEAGAGAGFTVLGFFIAPLWATIIASRFRKPQGVYSVGFAATPGSPVLASNGQFAQQQPYGDAGAYAQPTPGASHTAAPWAAPGWSASGPQLVAPSHQEAPRVAPAAQAPQQFAPAAEVPQQFVPNPGGALPHETEAEYARLAAESFLAPPAVPLGNSVAPEPFSWTAATQNPEPPAPAAPPPPVHPAATPLPPGFETASVAQEMGTATPKPAHMRSSGITARYDPLPPVPAPTVQGDDDLDLTVVVAKPSAVTWSIVLPDGAQLELQPDTIVGRRPTSESAGAAEGAHVLAIPDSTRTLSKVHARLRLTGDAWTVEDLGSTNGVFIFETDGTDREIAPHTEVLAGRHLMLGTLEVRLRRSDEGSKSE